MALELEFNLDAAKKAPQFFSTKTPQEINDWFKAVAKDAASNPKVVDAVERALVSQLKSAGPYADLFNAAAVKLEKGTDTPDNVRKGLGSFLPGISEALLKSRAAAYANIVKLKGPDMANPGLKYFADEAAKMTDADYAAFSKPLRVIATALSKINLPPPAQPKRKFVGS